MRRNAFRVLAVLGTIGAALQFGTPASAADPGAPRGWEPREQLPAEEVSAADFASFTDSTNDGTPFTACEADITSFAVNNRYDGLGLTTNVVCPSSPDSGFNWRIGVSRFEWYIDVDGDSFDDFVAVFWNNGDPAYVRVSVFDLRPSQPVYLCEGFPSWSATTFSALVPPSCIGSPATVRVQAFTVWDESPFSTTCTCPFDVAPNGFGYSPPIPRKEFVPLGDGPGAASPGPGVVDVFARGQDDALWTRHRTGGVWGSWTSLGGIITGTPAAASAGSGEVDVFARGQDNALWTQHFDGVGWSGWQSLGGILSSPAAVVSASPGTLDVFVAGNDRALYVRHFDGTSWGGWVRLGGIITAAPGAASASPGTIDVFARGQDDALWTQHFDSVWSGWSSLGGIINSAPAAASPSTGIVEVFARGSDDALWRRTTSGWASFGGQIASPPSAVVAGPGSYDVFARGQDFALWTIGSTDGGTSWGSWTSLGGIIR